MIGRGVEFPGVSPQLIEQVGEGGLGNNQLAKGFPRVVRAACEKTMENLCGDDGGDGGGGGRLRHRGGRTRRIGGSLNDQPGFVFSQGDEPAEGDETFWGTGLSEADDADSELVKAVLIEIRSSGRFAVCFEELQQILRLVSQGMVGDQLR